MTEQISGDDIRELMESHAMEPTLIVNKDGVIEVIPGPYLSDVHYGATVITTANDLRSSGDWDPDHATADDYAGIAEYLNSTPDWQIVDEEHGDA